MQNGNHARSETILPPRLHKPEQAPRSLAEMIEMIATASGPTSAMETATKAAESLRDDALKRLNLSSPMTVPEKGQRDVGYSEALVAEHKRRLLEEVGGALSEATSVRSGRRPVSPGETIPTGAESKRGVEGISKEAYDEGVAFRADIQKTEGELEQFFSRLASRLMRVEEKKSRFRDFRERIDRLQTRAMDLEAGYFKQLERLQAQDSEKFDEQAFQLLKTCFDELETLEVFFQNNFTAWNAPTIPAPTSVKEGPPSSALPKTVKP